MYRLETEEIDHGMHNLAFRTYYKIHKVERTDYIVSSSMMAFPLWTDLA